MGRLTMAGRLRGGLTGGIVAMVVCALACGVASAQQQPRNPEIGYAYPAGGKQGSDVEVTLGGQALIGPEQG
ncbi:MAG: hypothetical protein FJX72_15405, partial [Armatimonadetes bacterium]|nr:hypothetical protein [Armatimonadota bacterium]